MALARSMLRGIRAVSNKASVRTASRRYAVVANVDKVRHVPGGEFGYVPFVFSKFYPGFMAGKMSEWEHVTDLIYMDWNRRFSNAKYTAPFSPEQYKAVFGARYEPLSAGQVTILQLVVKMLASTEAMNALGSKYDAQAFELYKKFRFRVTEDNSAFGTESNAVAKPLEEKKPASWSATQKSAIPVSRAFFLPAWCEHLVDLTVSAPAIDIFKAYVAAFEKVANARKFPNSDAETAALYEQNSVAVDTALALLIDPSFKRDDVYSDDAFAKKLDSMDAESAKKEEALISEFKDKIKFL